MKQMKCFLVVLPVGARRGVEQGRHVAFKFDDDVHALMMKKMRYMYFDRWGLIRFKGTHMPLLRLLMNAKQTDTLACNGDRFDYQRCNWKTKQVCMAKSWMLDRFEKVKQQTSMSTPQ